MVNAVKGRNRQSWAYFVEIKAHGNSSIDEREEDSLVKEKAEVRLEVKLQLVTGVGESVPTVNILRG